MIISDNCISNWFFDKKGVEYSTPTVNMFINKDCFFNFLENIEEIVLDGLHFEYISTSKYANYSGLYRILYNKKYDIEFHNIHEQSNLDVITGAFNRRLKRLNLKTVKIICHERDNFLENVHLDRLSLLNFTKSRKFLISIKKYDGNFNNILLSQKSEHLKNIYEDELSYVKNRKFKNLYNSL